MDKLFIRTENGKIPIDPAIVEKYRLRRGMTSPMTLRPLVNEAGDATRAPEEGTDTDPARTARRIDAESRKDAELAELENGLTLKTSEILDFATGADSDPQG